MRSPGAVRVWVGAGGVGDPEAEGADAAAGSLGGPARRGGEAEVGAEGLAGALGHGRGDRFADRAVGVQQVAVDAELGRLGVGGVGDHPAQVVVGGAGDPGDPAAEESAGERLGGGQGEAVLLEQAADGGLQGLVVGAVDDVAELLADPASTGAISARASSRVGPTAVRRTRTSPGLARYAMVTAPAPDSSHRG